MEAARTNTLKVPGASLYYEVRGAGPVLLMIAGGNGDAGPFERVAQTLADRYTVVTYDRRGYSRSALDEPPDTPHSVETDGDDARRLLEILDDGPAHVFGSSSGAIVALDLLTRHSDVVATLVAHEPPLVTLLPDAAKQLEFMDGVYDTYRRSGVDAAMQEFSTGVGLDGGPQPPQDSELPPQLMEMVARIRDNLHFWLEHELRQYTRFVPDLEALQAVSGRLVPAGGRGSRGHLPYRPNTVLAERLHREIVDFPGDHTGYLTYPVDFAAQLANVLTIRA